MKTAGMRHRALRAALAAGAAGAVAALARRAGGRREQAGRTRRPLITREDWPPVPAKPAGTAGGDGAGGGGRRAG